MRTSHLISRNIQTFTVNKSMRVLASVALCCTMSSMAGSAFAGESHADAQAIYQQERANCLNGNTNEGRATCLKEAGAAYAAATRGKLEISNAQYGHNAALRCQALKDDDRAACERRVQGEGEVSGSAASGGVFRELTIEKQITPDTGAVQ